MKIRYLLFLVLSGLLFACDPSEAPTDELPASEIGRVTSRMTDLMVQDVTNPPLAGRFFAYATLAGYEVVALNDTAYKSMAGVLNDFPEIERPADIQDYSPSFSALLAMLQTAQKMQPSGAELGAYTTALLDSCKNLGFGEATLDGSVRYAEAISKQILAYAKADRYNQISNYPRYEPSGEKGSWYPTPPGYFAPVEPYFNTIRTFALDSAAQFKPIPPVAFSEDKNSDFFKMMLVNYKEELTEEEKVIAAFWDCNPFALANNGHLNVGMKKISPGAHWIGITDIACQKAQVDFSKAMLITMAASVGMMDAFVACWDEKYRSDRIRPETAIRQYIDPKWTPFLQTPPFPEYLSGHSVVSAAEAVILTHFLGEDFAYSDTVEERFGLQARDFKSFKQASQEAAISRFYGGIHYMDAIEVGVDQGTKVGNWVVKRLEGATP
ncbi:PAP2 superfamily protein [Dyadobacter jejuensis]|uniref:PAP2 superfamily protein n=1 Tax=Dyadobacter jejuensis TaxID=1082580 RepID=A0A316B9Y9_9BACT|nr:vanadium-dependent haloperoxidase [Dyadobacter jejuensis]PWJ59357.1 PAP2 superfamily protein [Dyadobacter jejuensis]